MNLELNGLTPYFQEKLSKSVHLAFCTPKEHQDKLARLNSEDLVYAQRLPKVRQEDWLSSRLALQELLPQYSSLRDLSFPHPRCSISHSRGEGWAVYSEDQEVEGIGIDFEMNRKVSPEAARFFLTQAEQIRFQEILLSPKSLLKIWTIKEAVFKSDLQNAGRGLKDYEMLTDSLVSGEVVCLKDKTQRFYYANWSGDERCITVSISKKVLS